MQRTAHHHHTLKPLLPQDAFFYWVVWVDVVCMERQAYDETVVAWLHLLWGDGILMPLADDSTALPI